MAGQKSPRERRRYAIGTGGGRHPERIEQKRAEAIERKKAWLLLSPREQIAALDNRLGKGVGARRQRARIARAA